MTESMIDENPEPEFNIGQKVVCIDACGGGPDDPKIVEGHIYTIRGIDPDTEELGVYLEGIENTTSPGWENPLSWRATRFRPMKEGDDAALTWPPGSADRAGVPMAED